MPSRRRLSASALLLLGLLAFAALATPALAAKKAAAAAGKKKAASTVGVLDTDEDEDAPGGLVGGYGDLGWISVADFQVREGERGWREREEGGRRAAGRTETDSAAVRAIFRPWPRGHPPLTPLTPLHAPLALPPPPPPPPPPSPCLA